MNSIKTPFFIPLQLSDQAHAYARKFAQEQATNWKAKQVYLNTLAVYAVHSYLQWMEFETKLSQSDSWNPGIRALFNVADLVLPGVGKLECRPVLPRETVVSLPPEVTEDRIGYVAVQFEEKLDTVKLLGFCRLIDLQHEPKEIPITNLKSFESLIEYLEELEGLQRKTRIDLSQWLVSADLIDKTWQLVQEILGTKRTQEVFATSRLKTSRQNVIRATKIELGIQPNVSFLALVVAVIPRVGQQRDVLLQVHPVDGQTSLPIGLKFLAFDNLLRVIAENQVESNREWIQLNISGQPGEEFSVKVELNDISVIRNFVI
jgi:hypothetical protein